MASQADTDGTPQPKGRRVGCWASLAMLFVLAIGVAFVWLSRERIAGNVFADELARRGIEASYTIDEIGPRRQVLRDIVIGDPSDPDLTIERAEVVIRYRLGFPAIASLGVVRPRLRASYREGSLSFGALDPLIFGEEEAPFELPDLRLIVEQGRGLLETDYGPVGVSLHGSGHLRSGFSAELAATAPRLAADDCEAERATLYGRLSVDARRPGFEGPVRLARLACPEMGLTLADAAVQLDGRADRTLSVFEGAAGLRTGRAAWGESRLAALAGTTRFTWRDGGLTARHDLVGTDLSTPQAAIARLEVDGWLRARRQFGRIELDSQIAGTGVRVGPGLDATLAEAAQATRDTLLGPILAQVRDRLAAESRASRLAAELTLRRTGSGTSLVVPTASLRGGSGATLLSLSRFQLAVGGDAAPRYTGSFATGGAGLPRIEGRMEPRPGGRVAVRLAMAEYVAGASRLAVPDLVLVQRADGVLGFVGEARASGALPGGRAERLVVPLAGNWSRARGVSLWNECTELRFEALQLANLTLARRSLTLCPPSGAAIVRYDARGLRIAAGAPSLDVAGTLGETPIAIRSGPVGFAYPGALSARRLLVTLGPAGSATTFAIDDLSAQVGGDVAGRFAGTDVRLYAVPLDLLGASGAWRYAGGRLELSEGAFRLVDRRERARFEPLVAEGATLTLADNVIVAEALLREPSTGRAVTEVDLRHDLASGRGHADLTVAGIRFDDRLQPVTLTDLAFGVVANVRGTVTGTGRIDWNEQRVTSSGRFSSNSLDFAAAFGPVRGASGTLVFTDLLGMTTAPNQRFRVASINPGIEVTDGEVVIEIRRGEVLALRGGTWPFMGGTLTLRPVDINIGEAEVRRYVLEIVGLEAARFVDRMGLNNISATGTFDGAVPLVFDAEGNGRLEGGLLLSRPPGGNVSYIGELTYEDLGAMANMAFAALRSLDYRQMSVAMDGELTGDIVTRVRMDGVSQGEGAARNIATRAIAGLPIRFVINVRAPFYSLLGSIRALYDPAAIRDPRDLGLLDTEGNVIRRETDGTLPPAEPDIPIPDESLIQRRESEETP
jgi:hypothetical protein